MSADNAILILKTRKGNGFEWRIAEIQNLELFEKPNDDPAWSLDSASHHLANIRELLSDNKTVIVCHSEKEAMDEAVKIFQELAICEYGIVPMTIDREF